ncbi:MAG: glycosyltransferase family 39 protein [Thermoleophilia bacterium]
MGNPLKNSQIKVFLVIAAAVIVLTVPFINQPFNQDDRDFVEFARASATDITKLKLENYTYGGKFFKNYRDPHGPLLTTCMGMALRMGAAESEAFFHGLYLIFPLIGAFSMYYLARRFTGHPLIATLLLLFTPGFLVLSHTLMDNLPGLSLALAAASLFILGADRDDGRLLAASGIVMTLAAVTAYQTLSLVPALIFYASVSKPRRLKRYLPFAFLAMGGAIWLLATYKVYGRFPALSYKIRGQAYQMPGFNDDYGLQLRPMLTTLGGTTIFPLSVLILFMRKNVDLLVAAALLLLVTVWTVLSFDGIEETDLTRLLQVVLLTFAGIMIVYKLFAHGITVALQGKGRVSTDALFLLSWFVSASVVYLVFLVPYVSARHLLLMFPPIILLFVREFEQLWPGRARLRILFIAATLFFTLGGGLAAAVADYRSASVYPVMAEQLADQYRQDPGSSNTIFIRGEFGFRYYLEQQGFKMLNDKSEIKTGDIVIYSTLASPSNPWPEGSYTELSRSEPGDDFPFRVWNCWAGAGFYTNRMGPLPIAFSRDIEDRIIVYQFHQ